MSTPNKSHDDKLQGAISELVSAMSALNMDADPIPGATGYLADTDAWAKHAMEHLHAVFCLLNDAHTEREVLRARIFRFEIAAAKTRADARHTP